MNLKPCPFCGGDAEISAEESGLSAELVCGGCGVMFRSSNRESLPRHWNARIAPPEAASAIPPRYDIDASVDWDGPDDAYAPAGLLDVYSSDHGEWVKWGDVQHLFAPSPQLSGESK